MSVGLDFSRPLWRFHLVERYGNRSAVVMRFHHCLADGISMVRVLFSMAQAKPDGTSPGLLRPGQRSSSQNSQRSSRELQTQQILRKLAGTVDVSYPPTRFGRCFPLGASTASALGQLFLSAPEINNTFRGRVGIPKRAAWSPAISLEQVKFLGRVFDCTVNDILLSTVAGALRRYMLDPARILLQSISIACTIDLRRGARVTKVNCCWEIL